MAGILADVLAGALTPGCEVVAAGLADVMADVLADGLTEFLADVLPHTLRQKKTHGERKILCSWAPELYRHYLHVGFSMSSTKIRAPHVANDLGSNAAPSNFC